MKILFVIDSLGSGGAQRQIVNLAIGLKAVNNLCEVFAYSNGDHFEPELAKAGVETIRSRSSTLLPFAIVLELRRLVVDHEIEAVIAFLPIPSLLAACALLRMPQVRLLVSERSSFPTGRPTLRDRWQRALHSRADFITANSFHQTELMRRAFPRSRSRLRTIYNGYDLDKFQPIEKRCENRKFHFAAVGRVTRGKNIENVILAMRLAREQGIDVRLDWIGRLDNAKWASGYYGDIAALIDKNCLGAAWRWLGERPNISALITQYDALIHPSFHEGLPNAVCEAFACGLPVLASAVCDHPRLIDPGVRGYLFDPNDHVDIAEKLTAFCALLPFEREHMAKNARGYAEQHLSLQLMCENYFRLLDSK